MQETGLVVYALRLIYLPKQQANTVQIHVHITCLGWVGIYITDLSITGSCQQLVAAVARGSYFPFC